MSYYLCLFIAISIIFSGYTIVEYQPKRKRLVRYRFKREPLRKKIESWATGLYIPGLRLTLMENSAMGKFQ